MSYQCAVNTSTDYYGTTPDAEKSISKKTPFRLAQTADGGFEYIKTLQPDTVTKLKNCLQLWPKSDLGNTLRLVKGNSGSVTNFKARKAKPADELPSDFIAVQWVGAKPTNVKEYVNRYRTALAKREDLTVDNLKFYYGWFGLKAQRGPKTKPEYKKALTKISSFRTGPGDVEYWPAAFFLRVPPFQDFSS